jgi:hypothetical protein
VLIKTVFMNFDYCVFFQQVLKINSLGQAAVSGTNRRKSAGFIGRVWADDK